ncbi:hypothetical protein A2886_00795 [candidate division WWE3 bacterium RIFCSPHIGHO2_01_FULL_42_13]|uniref:Polysaccharide biosynthesis protein C-terminal domain-containing protein n=1 Tax=candidate division WWE3 bacterium RIFCSPHIGHO2_01_FULL_42_13 TaxID=1802617 RepID=A0A1F4UQD4_UNCKA|nr:MAG: hypothetical protein A2886_00795 [candidate division WWE3 bacterium RIFCSPHIGHO2_01_FULL_42_13]
MNVLATKRSFFDIFIVGAGNGINAILGLLFFTAVARSLSIEDFGKYALLTSLLVSLSKIMDFGTNSLFVAKSITKPQDYISRFFSLKLILFLVTSVVAGIILYKLDLLSFQILKIFLIGAFGYGLNITLFAYFQRMSDFVKAVALNTLSATVKAIFAGSIFFHLLSVDLELAYAIFSGSIFTCILLIPWLPKGFWHPKVSLQNVKSFFLEALPAGISQIIKEGWSALANSLAKLTNTFSEVGIYSLASKIADIFTLISLSIFTVLLPRNAQRKKDNEIYDMKETLLLSGGVLFLALVAMVTARYLTVPIFGEKFSASLGLLNILILAAAITAVHSFMDNYFFVEEKTKTLMKIGVSKLIFFVGSALILTNLYDLRGLAISNLLASIFALILTLRIIFKRS